MFTNSHVTFLFKKVLLPVPGRRSLAPVARQRAAQPDPALRPIRCTLSSAPGCCFPTIRQCYPRTNRALLTLSTCRESRKGWTLYKVDLLKCTGLAGFPGWFPGFCNLRIEKTDVRKRRPIRCPVCQLALRIAGKLSNRRIRAGCGILVEVPCMLWCSSLPQQFSAADHLSGQVVMHPDTSWMHPGLRAVVTMVHFAEGKLAHFSIFLKKRFACIRFPVFMRSNV